MKQILLPVKIDEGDLIDYGNRLAQKEKQLVRLKEEKKEVAKKYGDSIKAVEADIAELTKAIDEREVEEMVEVKTTPDPDKWEMITTRMDTGEVVSTRNMTEKERLEHGRLDLVGHVAEKTDIDRSERKQVVVAGVEVGYVEKRGSSWFGWIDGTDRLVGLDDDGVAFPAPESETLAILKDPRDSGCAFGTKKEAVEALSQWRELRDDTAPAAPAEAH